MSISPFAGLITGDYYSSDLSADCKCFFVIVHDQAVA